MTEVPKTTKIMNNQLKSAFTIKLPFPPSLNALWDWTKLGKGNRPTLSDIGRAYRAAVHSAVAVQQSDLPYSVLTGRLAVRIEGFAPDKRKRDIDNWCKAILDSIEATGKVFLDDGQIDRLEVIRRTVSPRDGFVMVTIVILPDSC